MTGPIPHADPPPAPTPEDFSTLYDHVLPLDPEELDDLDEGAMRPLLYAMNALPGIVTTESCCGHGNEPFRVWFLASDWDARGMMVLAREMCDRYSMHAHYWRVTLYHGDLDGHKVQWLLESTCAHHLTEAHALLLAASLESQLFDRAMGFNLLYGRPSPNRTDIRTPEEIIARQRVGLPVVEPKSPVAVVDDDLANLEGIKRLTLTRGPDDAQPMGSVEFIEAQEDLAHLQVLLQNGPLQVTVGVIEGEPFDLRTPEGRKTVRDALALPSPPEEPDP